MMRPAIYTPVPLWNESTASGRAENQKQKSASLPLARCARVPRATVRLTALSSCRRGFCHPRSGLPPSEGYAPVDRTRRAFAPSMDLQTRGDFALPMDPMDQGPCPMDLREERSALTHPDQPSTGWIRDAAEAGRLAKAQVPSPAAVRDADTTEGRGKNRE